MRRREYPIVEEVTELSDTPKFSDIKSIAYSAVQQFETGVYDELYICYNRFLNAISQVPTVDRLLPMDAVGEGTQAQVQPMNTNLHRKAYCKCCFRNMPKL